MASNLIPLSIVVESVLCVSIFELMPSKNVGRDFLVMYLWSVDVEDGDIRVINVLLY